MSQFKAKIFQILFPASVPSFVRVKLHLRDRRMDCPSVRLLDGVWHSRPFVFVAAVTLPESREFQVHCNGQEVHGAHAASDYV